MPAVYHFVTMVSGSPRCGCGVSVACCPYPWPDPEGNQGGPFYPPEDLPDSITILGVTLNHVVGEYLFLSVDELTNAFAGGEDWISSGAFPLQGTPCLIGDDPGVFPTPIEDEFLDNYTVDYDEGGGPQSVVITRETLCTWTNSVENWGLEYVGNMYNTYPHPSIPSKPGYLLSHGSAVYYKEDPQSAPTGTYQPAFLGGNPATIS